MEKTHDVEKNGTVYHMNTLYTKKCDHLTTFSGENDRLSQTSLENIKY